MRRFWLEIVGTNAVIDLNSCRSTPFSDEVNRQNSWIAGIQEALFLSNISGLGFGKNGGYSFVEPFAFVKMSETPEQTVIAGKLNIKAPAYYSQYYAYNCFISLIEGQKLRLRYAPLDSMSYASAYLLDVEITKLEKTEIRAGLLECGIEMRSTTTWYTILSETFNITAETSHVDIPTRAAQGVVFSDYLNSYTFTLTILSVDNASGYLDLAIERGNEPSVSQILLSGLELSEGDIFVWSNDPDNPRVTVNGSDASENMLLGETNFAPFAGQGFSFWCFGCTASVQATYKRYYRSV